MSGQRTSQSAARLLLASSEVIPLSSALEAMQGMRGLHRRALHSSLPQPFCRPLSALHSSGSAPSTLLQQAGPLQPAASQGAGSASPCAPLVHHHISIGIPPLRAFLPSSLTLTPLSLSARFYASSSSRWGSSSKLSGHGWSSGRPPLSPPSPFGSAFASAGYSSTAPAGSSKDSSSGSSNKQSGSGGSGSSGSSTVGTKAPAAEDCDQALMAHDELREKLDNLKKPSTMRNWDTVVRDLALGAANIFVATARFLFKLPGYVLAYSRMSKEEWAAKRASAWKVVKHEAHHYWVGTKLLGFDIKVATRLLFKSLRGKELSRRERTQLTRTTADIFRLVPLIVILVIPFMELALPILLKLFPNMLPTTYEDKLQKEAAVKRRLAVRLELARFLQDTVAEMAKDLRKRSTGDKSATAAELYQFIKKVRSGEPVENDEILRFGQLFNDELTLDNLERMQLVSMAQFVGISPFGTDQFLRTRLRKHLSQIKSDDYEIEKEGLENLTEDELRSAARARGMRAPYGEGATEFMRRQLRDWLDLSLHRGLPSSLLLLSRAFTITASVKDMAAKKALAYDRVRETLGVIPEEVVDSVEFANMGGNDNTPAALEKKLEFLKREEELIREEAEADAEASAEEASSKAAETAAAAGPPPVPSVGAYPSGAIPVAGGAAAATIGSGGDGDGAPADAIMGKVANAAAAVAVAKATAAKDARSLGSDATSAEEKATKAAVERERKLSSILHALLDLASHSGVTKERAMFMSLVSTEMDRLNQSLAEQGGGTSRTLQFTNKGLTSSDDEFRSDDEVANARPAAGGYYASSASTGSAAKVPVKPASPADNGAPKQLSDRVSAMLHNIELELDAADAKIGDKMHVLDTDNDGVVSAEELKSAVSFLKEQLGEDDLRELFSRLGVSAERGPSGAETRIPLSELLALIKGEQPETDAKKQKRDKGSKDKGKVVGAADGGEGEVEKIHIV